MRQDAAFCPSYHRQRIVADHHLAAGQSVEALGSLMVSGVLSAGTHLHRSTTACGVSCLPLHLLLLTSDYRAEAARVLLEAFPESAVVPNGEGLLPLDPLAATRAREALGQLPLQLQHGRERAARVRGARGADAGAQQVLPGGGVGIGGRGSPLRRAGLIARAVAFLGR